MRWYKKYNHVIFLLELKKQCVYLLVLEQSLSQWENNIKKQSEQSPVTFAFAISTHGLETPAVITDADKPENHNTRNYLQTTVICCHICY